MTEKMGTISGIPLVRARLRKITVCWFLSSGSRSVVQPAIFWLNSSSLNSSSSSSRES